MNNYERKIEALRLVRLYSKTYLNDPTASVIDEDELEPFLDFVRDCGHDDLAAWIKRTPNHPLVRHDLFGEEPIEPKIGSKLQARIDELMTRPPFIKE